MMIDLNNTFREMALSFPETEEAAHFDRISFKIKGKRIFATLHEKSATANLKLAEVDQSVFSDFGTCIYPVDNKWGKQGWTTFELKAVPPKLQLDALNLAFQRALHPK